MVAAHEFGFWEVGRGQLEDAVRADGQKSGQHFNELYGTHTFRSTTTRNPGAANRPVRLNPHSTCSCGADGTLSTPTGCGMIRSPMRSTVRWRTGVPRGRPIRKEAPGATAQIMASKLMTCMLINKARNDQRSASVECGPRRIPTSCGGLRALREQPIVLLDAVKCAERERRQAMHDPRGVGCAE